MRVHNDSLGGRKLVVDLTGVAVIRRDGSHVLRDIKNRGIEVIRLAVSFAAAPLLSWPPSPFLGVLRGIQPVVGQPIQLPSSAFRHTSAACGSALRRRSRLWPRG